MKKKRIAIFHNEIVNAYSNESKLLPVKDHITLICSSNEKVSHLFGSRDSHLLNELIHRDLLLPQPIKNYVKQPLADKILLFLQVPLLNENRITLNATTHLMLVKEQGVSSNELLIHIQKIDIEDESHLTDSDLLAMLLDASPDDIYFKDRYSRFIRINNATARKLGLKTPEDALGKTDFDFFEREIAERTFSDEQAILLSGESIKGKDEYGVLQEKAGTVMWGSTSKFPMKNSFGDIIGLVGITRDITDKKETEFALAEREEQLRILTDNILDLVTVSDSKGKIIYVSPSVKQILGYDPDQFLNKWFEDLIHPEDLNSFVKPILRRIIQNELPGTMEYRIQRNDGSYLWLSTNVKPFYNKRGNQLELISVSRDVTQVHDLMNQLKQSITQKDRLFSVISHDLRGPVASILSMSKLLLETYDSLSPNELAEYFNLLIGSTEKLSNLMDELLTWSKAQLNSLKATFGVINVQELFDSVQNALHSQLKKKHVEICFMSNGIKEFESDFQMIFSILRNFISNSIKYSSENQQIDVEIRKEKNEIIFIITDRGVGIPADKIQKLLFSSTFDSTYGTKGEKGTGLGLQICKDFAQQVGGKIHLESKPDLGTKAFLFLPVKVQAH